MQHFAESLVEVHQYSTRPCLRCVHYLTQADPSVCQKSCATSTTCSLHSALEWFVRHLPAPGYAIHAAIVRPHSGSRARCGYQDSAGEGIAAAQFIEKVIRWAQPLLGDICA